MDDRIAELLEKWEEAADQGEELSVEELCRECPELIEELRWRITALKRTSWTKKPLTDDPIQGTKPTDFGLPETLGRYFLESLLGTGGFGQVWKAFDPQLKRPVALKIPRRDKLAAPDHFLAEAQKVARLRHPGIVPVHDVGSQEGVFYIVSEFIEGGSLADRLTKGTPWRTETLTLIADVADALHHAHERGFVHRDIKPSNILLDEHGKPFLADFGIAVTSQETQASSLGTLPYMAPEQLGEGKADVRSDIYSLGVVLYQLLMGRLPFDAADPGELRQKILTEPVGNGGGAPGELLAVCKKCLAKNPAERFASADELATALRFALGASYRSLWRTARWAIGVLLILLVVVAGWGVWRFAGSSVENNQHEPITKIEQPDPQPTNVVQKNEDGWLALAPLVETGRDIQGGKWMVNGDVVEFKAGRKVAYVSVPVAVNGSYDVEFRLTLTKVTDAITLFLPIANGRTVRLEMRGTGGNAGSSTVSARLLGVPTTDAKADTSMKVGVEYAFLCKIKSSDVRAEVSILRDDKPLFHWSGRIDQITGTHLMRPQTIGWQAAYYSSSQFSGLKLKMAEGKMDLLTNTLFEVRRFEGHKGRVTSLVLSSDGKSFVTGSLDRTVRLWNLETAEAKVIDQQAEVTAVAMSSDEKTVACGSITGVVRLFDVSGAEPKELHSFTQQTTPITALTFSPQGKFLFAGSKDGSFLSWNLGADPPRAMPWPKTEGVPVTACFLKSNMLAVGIGSEPEQPGRFWYWAVDETEAKVDPLLTPVIQDTAHVTALAFSPNASWVLTACHPTGVAVWKLKPGWKEIEAVGVYQGQIGGVNGVVVSHDNLLVASAGADGTVRAWTLGNQGEYHRFEGHTGPVQAVVFTPDRRYVLSAGDDGTVLMWRVAHGG